MDRRHHHASRPVVILIEAGSPETIRQAKPKPYPRQERQRWTGPPRRDSKAAALQRLLDALRHNDATARSILRPDAAALKAWLRAA